MALRPALHIPALLSLEPISSVLPASSAPCMSAVYFPSSIPLLCPLNKSSHRLHDLSPPNNRLAHTAQPSEQSSSHHPTTLLSRSHTKHTHCLCATSFNKAGRRDIPTDACLARGGSAGSSSGDSRTAPGSSAARAVSSVLEGALHWPVGRFKCCMALSRQPLGEAQRLLQLRRYACLSPVGHPCCQCKILNRSAIHLRNSCQSASEGTCGMQSEGIR